ncbi:MAG: DUF4392 domain-containing protein [Planctomycetia bacterium]|nr:DUF4392 domain-containing protein [Planctomycetia bacterium]
MPTDPAIPWATLESLLRRDPTRRGLASYSGPDGALCEGHLAAAARDLADNGTAVAVVTGFCIVDATPPAAETDGPPSALFLARTLRSLGIETLLIGDRYGLPLLEVGCDRWGLPREMLREFPLVRPAGGADADVPQATAGDASVDAWVREFLHSGVGTKLSHLIAIERVGPSHTLASLAAQKRTRPAPTADFCREVPEAHRDVCHNMRGAPIDACTAPVHRLFEAATARQPRVTTIGIGDGGNEIGMGTIPWETLRAAITLGPTGRLACRIPTDYTLVAGISDWAGYALALATARLRGRCDEAAGWDVPVVRALIESLVHDAGAVDGVTARKELSVDGLPLETYLQVFAGIRDLCLRG